MKVKQKKSRRLASATATPHSASHMTPSDQSSWIETTGLTPVMSQVMETPCISIANSLDEPGVSTVTKDLPPPIHVCLSSSVVFRDKKFVKMFRKNSQT